MSIIYDLKFFVLQYIPPVADKYLRKCSKVSSKRFCFEFGKIKFSCKSLILNIFFHQKIFLGIPNVGEYRLLPQLKNCSFKLKLLSNTVLAEFVQCGLLQSWWQQYFCWQFYLFLRLGTGFHIPVLQLNILQNNSVTRPFSLNIRWIRF